MDPLHCQVLKGSNAMEVKFACKCTLQWVAFGGKRIKMLIGPDVFVHI